MNSQKSLTGLPFLVTAVDFNCVLNFLPATMDSLLQLNGASTGSVFNSDVQVVN